MSDVDATRVRHDVAAEVDEIIEHVINANMLNMPYDVYSELFDAVGGLGVKVEKMLEQAEADNAKLRQELAIREASEQEKVIDYLGKENVDWEDRYRALAKENGELRKLCADLRFCRRHNCLTCSHGRFCDMRFDERYAELGIEPPNE